MTCTMKQFAGVFHTTEDSLPGAAIPLYAAKGADTALVRQTEELLGIPAAPYPGETPPGGVFLRLNGEGLALVGKGCALRGDFSRLLPRLTPNNLNHELLIRACKLKAPPAALTAVDATAGLGEDAFLLAAAGFHVRLFERDSVIAALLADALRRGSEHPALAPIVGRMTLSREDSVSALPRLTPAPCVVVLDPMFPERQKSALVKKKLQLIQCLERPCQDEGALLEAAMACKPLRVVVKRPLKGPWLAGVKPHYSIRGKSIRYDCFAVARSAGQGDRP